MGLLDRFRKTNAIQLNDVPEMSCQCGWDGLFNRKGERDYADTFLWEALNTLYSGISNVTFKTSKGESAIAQSICDFIDRNATLLINQYFRKGYICVFYDSKRNYYIVPKDDLIKVDALGRVINNDAIVIYSPMYQLKRTTMFDKVKPLLDMLNSLMNTMAESNRTMGTLPIISGNSIPANPQFKEALANAMSKDYGFGKDQMKYFLSQTELKVDKIDLNIKDLELRENVNEVFKKLLNYFEIPVDLVIGNSTYDNVASARIYFYETTIRKYAEILLRVARNLLTASNTFLPQSTITYKIENVSGLDKTISDMCNETNAYIDVLIKLQESGVDVSDELQSVYLKLTKDFVEV